MGVSAPPPTCLLMSREAVQQRKLRAAMEVLAIITIISPSRAPSWKTSAVSETSKGTLDVLMETG